MQGLGGRVDREIPIINGFSARVPRSAVRALRGTPGVRSVHPTAASRCARRPTRSLAPSTTLDTLRGDRRRRHASTAAPSTSRWSTPASRPTPRSPATSSTAPTSPSDARVDELRNLDAFGHGTHLAGIIAAVAPQARVVNVKVADHEGSTSLGRLLAGIDWTVRRGDRDGLNVRVLNLAFGAEVDGSYRNDPLAFAVERAWDRGRHRRRRPPATAAPTADSLDSPAYDPYVIAVGAEDSGGTATLADDGMALFSSRGSITRGPDVVAPGVAVVSTRVPGSFLDEAFPAARVDDGFRGSGTSQSAAVVSGAAALLIGERSQPRRPTRSRRCCARPPARSPAPTRHSRAPAWSTSPPPSRSPSRPARARRFPEARIGGWMRGALRNQYAVENPQSNRWWRSNRWSSNRWASNRWASNRWSSNRWSSNRWSSNRWSSVEWGGGS